MFFLLTKSDDTENGNLQSPQVQFIFSIFFLNRVIGRHICEIYGGPPQIIQLKDTRGLEIFLRDL